MNNSRRPKYGFIKPAIDAHTLGINSAAELLRDCGYEVVMAEEHVAKAMNDIKHEIRRNIIIDWLVSNKIDRLGISYRLDYEDAVNMMGYLVEGMKSENLLQYQGGQIELLFFGGLPKACEIIDKRYKGLIKTFIGGESIRETLERMGVSKDEIPHEIHQGSRYDELLIQFGKQIIDSQDYLDYQPNERYNYPEYGTKKDTVLKRLEASSKQSFRPLMRAHVGPYSVSANRIESVNEFLSWLKPLAHSNYLDILSIGTSQLTQSNFGEDWEGKTNGGGVPINSPDEYRMIWDQSRPLLVRTYAGTKNILNLAQMHEQTINICWHALSFWWFSKLDGRGPYDVYSNLKQHIETIKYIAKTRKPFEANVPHHFAFRGADDVTYIVSAYLTAKLSKKLKIKTFILQNMLNTPKLTWGIQDLAKSRAMLELVRSLEDTNFKVLVQTRAGLDYFKPNLYEARVQLAAVTALMDDIEPNNEKSPSIVHVVSYSEASHLATPEVINESIRITEYSLMKYRQMRKQGKVEDMTNNPEVHGRTSELLQSARQVIMAIEHSIDDPYSVEGFYLIFAAGFLPVPYLWGETNEFKHAKNWKTEPVLGSIKVVDENNTVMRTEQIIEIAKNNLKDAEYNLKHRIMDAL